MRKLKSLFCGHSYMGRIFPKAGHTPDSCSHPDYLRMVGGLKFWNYEAEGIVPFVATALS